MKDEILSSEREQQINEEIRQIFNSGNCKAALEKSIEFLKEFPTSYLARYQYAVMNGDYSNEVGLSDDERKKYREICNKGIKDLVEASDFSKLPKDFQFRVRNEYYWFFELHKEQYELGIERIKENEIGHYSASVGASMLAMKFLRDANLLIMEDWAERSYKHFEMFERFLPNWYNINYFGAQSLACLGKYDEALICYKDMYRKQQGPINEIEVAEFLKSIEEIKKLRKVAFK